PAVKATMMGCVFLTLFLSNTIIGRLGSLYEHMTPMNFWATHAAIAAIGGTLALIVNRPLGRLFHD
ncbi:MAG: MFS transporter, partial [Alphaproteobacteria bacterium]|nr:MFS transporter [Alphaproteobacteria bacterium]